MSDHDEEEECFDCPGWHIFNGCEIQRCDACQKFSCDDEAIAEVERFHKQQSAPRTERFEWWTKKDVESQFWAWTYAVQRADATADQNHDVWAGVRKLEKSIQSGEDSIVLLAEIKVIIDRLKQFPA
jgi:hypothetical protein